MAARTPRAAGRIGWRTRRSFRPRSWRVTRSAKGGAHVVYRFSVDPGGMIPPFLADLANKGAIPDTFKAVEKEANRLAKARPAVALGG